MRKFSRSAFPFVALATLGITVQAAEAAPDNLRAMERSFENATRHAFNAENQIRGHRERFLQMSQGGGARQQNENRILRLQNRLGIDTAASIQAMQNQLSAERVSRRLTNLNLNGLPSDLNLRSRRDSYVLPSLSGNVTIERGGQQYVIDNTTKLTAAEVAAVHQVLNEGGQSLSLARGGNAEAGSLTLDAATVQGLNTLSIPKNVTITGDFTTSQQLGIAGDLHNAGNLLVRSGDPSVASATISASNIRNTRSGSITTADTIDLNLNAFADIVNHGSINGNRNVTLTAGGAIYNVSEPGSRMGDPLATISAGSNLNLQSSNIVNQGIASASAGNINIADQLPIAGGNHLVSVYGHGGTFSAEHGDITIGTNSLVASDAIVLTGGDYHSKKLIVNAGDGSADGIVGDVTGELKVSAGIAHIGASTDNLNLGQSVITGDPTFFNDAGSITITGDLIFGEAIAILASQDVTDNGIARNITARNGDDGQTVTIIAGATLEALGGAVSNPNAQPGSEITQGTVEVSKPSKTGGSVLLSNSKITTSGLNDGMGGLVTVIALAGKTTGGIVEIAGIDASGAGLGANGNVDIFAGSSQAIAIEAQDIQTGNGSGGAGGILLANNQVKLDLTFDSSGNFNGTIDQNKKMATGGIDASTVSALGGTIEILTGGTANLGVGGTAISVDGLAESDAGSITVAAGAINIEGSVQASGGAGVDGVSEGDSGTDGGAGGAISLTATEAGIDIINSGFVVSSGGAGGIGKAGTSEGTDGGAGADGGAAGNVSLNAPVDINVGGLGIASLGGLGGSGGDGADGGAIIFDGGAGGDSGAGGNSGNLSLISDGGDIFLNPGRSIVSVAGSGGTAGNGGNGISLGAGGDGGNTGGGGDAGQVSVTTPLKSGSIVGDVTAEISALAGIAGIAGTGGNGGTATTGTGGAGGDGGNTLGGGVNGSVTISSKLVQFAGLISATNVAGSGAAGSGGVGGTVQNGTGGNGGQGGSSGDNLAGGKINITGGTLTLGTLSVAGEIGSSGGTGGGGGSATSDGGGGNGGFAGGGGGGGLGGLITISATSIDAQFITAKGGGGGQGGSGGLGAGANVSDTGGDGGNGGASGAQGGGGGIILFTKGKNSNIAVNILDASSGTASNAGSGGNGGISHGGGNGGDGGSGGAIGLSANGGTIDVESGLNVNLNSVSVAGGNAAAGGNGGLGGDGPELEDFNGGNGGSGSAGVSGGAAGGIEIRTKKGTVTSGAIQISGGNGSTGGSAGSGGNAQIGGTGGLGKGGFGGIAGSGGNGGDAGSLTVESKGILTITGPLLGTGGKGGAGGNGGNGGDASDVELGTIGGDGATGGAGGIGSSATVTVGGLNIVNLDFSGGDGGLGGNGGNGGSAFAVPNFGGAGGKAGAGGAAGEGGSIQTGEMKGNITIGAATVSGGRGGNGGFGGDGGASAFSTGIAGGDAGDAGNGGSGGRIELLTSKGTVTATTSLDAEGGDGGTGGTGGAAGGGFVFAGAGGDGGDGGNGGNGGEVTTSTAPGITPSAAGGSGGAGGPAGPGDFAALPGNPGTAGQPGTVTP